MSKFEDLILLGRTDPVVHNFLLCLEKGDMTKEEALIGMVKTLVDQKRDVVDKYMKHMEKCTTPSITT